jgi:uncharacterized protein (TIGR00255 family)
VRSISCAVALSIRATISALSSTDHLMARSMTAFSSAEQNTATSQLRIEIRSVNHRFLELTIKLPEELRSVEPHWRDRIQKRFQRGKVDVYVRYKSTAAQVGSINDEAIAQLLKLAFALQTQHPALRPIGTAEVLAWPGVVAHAEVDTEALRGQANALLEQALDEFDAARTREGNKLADVLLERVQQLSTHREKALTLLPGIRAQLKEKLQARMTEFQGTLDPARLEAELVLNLQKLDVDEELERLRIHLLEAQRILATIEPMGRRLDFLVQELHRECNTFGAKSVDAQTSQMAVDMKVLVEQFREQVQNIE